MGHMRYRVTGEVIKPPLESLDAGNNLLKSLLPAVTAKPLSQPLAGFEGGNNDGGTLLPAIVRQRRRKTSKRSREEFN
jgi:hypothetical protein